MGGSVTTSTVTYSAPVLTIEVYGTGDYTSTYSAFALMVNPTGDPGNVIMIQPY